LNPRPKIQTYGVYMLVLSIDVARRLPDRRGGRQASLRKISPLSSHRQRVRSYPANRRPIRSRKNEPGGRWPSTKRPWHSHSHWQLYCFHLFYEQGGTSACNRNPDDPRRNRFAPFRFVCGRFVVNVLLYSKTFQVWIQGQKKATVRFKPSSRDTWGVYPSNSRLFRVSARECFTSPGLESAKIGLMSVFMIFWSFSRISFSV
jgi:hypothetical protein